MAFGQDGTAVRAGASALEGDPSQDPTGISRSWLSLPRKVLWTFLAADVTLTLVYAAILLMKISRKAPIYNMFDVNQEMNVPSWYSSVQLLMVGLVLLALVTPLFKEYAPIAKLRRFWLVLGIGFVYLSADEGGVIHERLSQMAVGGAHSKATTQGPLASLLRSLGFKGSFKGGGTWIVLYLVIAVVLLAVLAPHIRRVLTSWPRESMLVLVGLALLFAGGIVAEGIADVTRIAGKLRLVEVGVEELLEMIGVSIVLFGTTSVLARAAVAVGLGPHAALSDDSAEDSPHRASA